MDNGLVLIILLLVMNKNRENKSLEKSVGKEDDILDTKPDTYLDKPIDKSITLNIPYTIEKVKIMKKIGPYFPEEFIPALNKSLILTEKIIRVYELIEFMQITEAKYIKEPIPVENNRERISHIINTIQKEIPKEDMKNMGMTMEMVVNIDKYKKMFTILNSVMSNPDSLNDPNKMLSLIEPLLQGKDEKEKEKLKDMAKMLEIMNTLDTPKKAKAGDNKTNTE